MEQVLEMMMKENIVGTNTEQKIKQRNVGGDGSSQFNCGQNNIGEEL